MEVSSGAEHQQSVAPTSELGQLVEEAQDHLRRGWSSGCARATRTFSELLTQHICHRNNEPLDASPSGDKESQRERLDRLLRKGLIDGGQSEALWKLWTVGNRASHWKIYEFRRRVTKAEAHEMLLSSRTLLEWFGEPAVQAKQPGPSDKVVDFPNTGQPIELDKRKIKPEFQDTIWPSVIRASCILILAAIAFVAYEHYFSGAQVSSWPQTYAVAPGGISPAANVRSGGGAEFRVIRSLSRGTVVVGIGDTLDRKNARWIKLADGAGYMKASILQPQAKPFTFDEAISRVTLAASNNVMQWGLLLICVVGVGMFSFWGKIRPSSAVTLVVIMLGAFYYRTTIVFWWEHPFELFYSATRPIAELTSVPQQDWMHPASTLRCNLLSHCTANLTSDQETDPISFTQIDGQPANVHLCTDIPIWFDQDGPSRIKVHGWFEGRDLGILSMTRSVADRLRSNPGAELPVDQVAFGRADPSVHSFEYWFVYGTCEAGPS